MKKVSTQSSDDWKSVSKEPINVEIVDNDSSSSIRFLALGIASPSSSRQPVTYRRIADWDDVSYTFAGISTERNVLRSALSNLWKTYRFNQHYIGFLAGGVSSEDFQEASEKYASTLQSLHHGILRQSVHIILDALPSEDLTPQDLSVILNVDPNQMELAFRDDTPNGKKEIGRIA